MRKNRYMLVYSQVTQYRTQHNSGQHKNALLQRAQTVETRAGAWKLKTMLQTP